jgi:hypothetical protein
MSKVQSFLASGGAVIIALVALIGIIVLTALNHVIPDVLNAVLVGALTGHFALQPAPAPTAVANSVSGLTEQDLASIIAALSKITPVVSPVVSAGPANQITAPLA